ncbi:NAD-dependent epimerase/dehydratase family protein [Polaromonas sp. P1(28)-13]|nr:NAD-dependent epimerase/dehydratase family protein [Polaromonas sp. P1(28)-13]
MTLRIAAVPERPSMKILVTGGSGFFGAYLTESLEAAGHEVFGYDLAPPAQDLLAVAPRLAHGLRQGSILDEERLLQVCRDDGIQAIVHAAALSRAGAVP